MADILTFHKYRGAFGVEYQQRGGHWARNLRDVKRYAREKGFTQVTIIDSYGHVQRPRVLILEV